MKRRIVVKALNGLGNIKPLTPDESFKIYEDLNTESPDREPTVMDRVFKGFEYALNPFMAVSDYLQNQDWVPNMIKEAAPSIAMVTGMAAGRGKPGRPGPVGNRAMTKNPAASRGLNKSLEGSKVEAELNSDGSSYTVQGEVRGARAKLRRAEQATTQNNAEAASALDKLRAMFRPGYKEPQRMPGESNRDFFDRVHSDYQTWQINQGFRGKDIHRVEPNFITATDIKAQEAAARLAAKARAAAKPKDGLPNTQRRAAAPTRGKGRPSSTTLQKMFEHYKTTTPRNFTRSSLLGGNARRAFIKDIKEWFAFNKHMESTLTDPTKLALHRARHNSVVRNLRLAGYDLKEFL